MKPPKKVRNKLQKKETPPAGGRAMERMKQFKKAREDGKEPCDDSAGTEKKPESKGRQKKQK